MTELGRLSQMSQLQVIIASVSQNNIQPLLLCDGQDDVSTACGFRPYKEALKEAGSHTQPIIWLCNDSWLAQQPQELTTTQGHFAAVPANSALMQGHGTHYFVMSYSLANAPNSFEDVQGSFGQVAAGNFVVKTVFTTVEPEVSSPVTPLAAGKAADNGVLPYMLVVFEVGTPPLEATSSSSDESAGGLGLIDLTDDSQAASAESQQEVTLQPSASKKQLGENAMQAEAAKKHASQLSPQAAASEARQRPFNAAIASFGSAEQDSTAGTSGRDQPLGLVGSSRLQTIASGSVSGQPQTELPGISNAQASPRMPGVQSDQGQTSGLAVDHSSAEEVLTAPSGLGQARNQYICHVFPLVCQCI